MTLRTRLRRLEQHTPAPATARTINLSDRELAQIILMGRVRAREAGLEEYPSDLSDEDLQQIIDGDLPEEGGGAK